MGGAKRMMGDQEEKRQVALRIAIEAEVLRVCEFHEDVFEGGVDVEEAYKLGNSQYTSGELSKVFSTRREMTDLIQDVVSDHPAEECPSCARHRDAD